MSEAAWKGRSGEPCGMQPVEGAGAMRWGWHGSCSRRSPCWGHTGSQWELWM